MKNNYFSAFFIVILLGVFTIKAQNNDYYTLVHEGKVWNETKREGQMPSKWRYTSYQRAFSGNTITNNIPYKKMYVSTKKYPISPQNWTLQNFMREDEDKKVGYRKNSNSVEKFYHDFSLEIRDQVPDNLEYAHYVIPVVSHITYENFHELKIHQPQMNNY